MIIPQTRPTSLPPGWYRATVLDAQPVTGEFGEQIELTFMIDGPGGVSHKVRAWCAARFSPASKLYTWAEAIFGRAIPETYDLDTEHLKGRAVDIRLERRVGAKGEFVKVVGLARAGSMTASTDGDSDIPF